MAHDNYQIGPQADFRYLNCQVPIFEELQDLFSAKLKHIRQYSIKGSMPISAVLMNHLASNVLITVAYNGQLLYTANVQYVVSEVHVAFILINLVLKVFSPAAESNYDKRPFLCNTNSIQP